ncbi:MAG: hypothetical protein KIS92_26525 [Planctomycetota bacterium]|nr:hypothetical protein [Planctomycetota bacterium]
MPKICLVIGLKHPAAKTKVVQAIREITGMPLNEILHRLARRIPMIEVTLFGNNMPEITAQLRSLIKTIPEACGTIKIYELPDDAALENNSNLAAYEIPATTLGNILRGFEERIRGLLESE